MDPFIRISGAAAPMPQANLDTDVIMPKQFLKGIDRAGLSHGLFHDLRFFPSGELRPDFVLNRPGWQQAKFLVVGPNFGCGSSREHAVWGLMQFGIRAIIGTSFAGIFNDNCQRNGLLTVVSPPEAVERMLALAADPSGNTLSIDLPAQTITTAGADGVFRFEIDALRKDALIRGLDAIGTTLGYADDIRRFEKNHWLESPWLALKAP